MALLQASVEAMQFGQTLICLFCTIISAYPRWGTDFMSKLYLEYTYMRVCFFPKDLPQLALVVPPHLLYTNTLIGFHRSLPMGYVDSGGEPRQ